MFSAVHHEREQGKAPALEEQDLWHPVHAAHSVPLHPYKKFEIDLP